MTVIDLISKFDDCERVDIYSSRPTSTEDAKLVYTFTKTKDIRVKDIINNHINRYPTSRGYLTKCPIVWMCFVEDSRSMSIYIDAKRNDNSVIKDNQQLSTDHSTTMTVKDLKKLISIYDDDTIICIMADGVSYDVTSMTTLIGSPNSIVFGSANECCTNMDNEDVYLYDELDGSEDK